ncbi:MAG: histidinol dehydrogenase [Deltaproteobacteria bacterium]|nr:histidinol dehydrogenase [Deltaproteobacteria bacterium]
MRLRRLPPDEALAQRRDPVDAETLRRAGAIVDDVRARGEVALREHARRLGDLEEGAPLILDRAALERTLHQRTREEWELLEIVAQRINAFAMAQKSALSPVSVAIPGGVATHDIAPIERAGCYAPGGRFPLPSSVLMTAVTARAAGAREVWVASPRPSAVTIAAAAVAGADALLTVGGAQAIAALAYGAGSVPACDVVVGPGNRWVTAAKQLVAGRVGIDMLAGPSELLIIADGAADPRMIAADLLAQAEHDEDALPILVSVDAPLLDAVDAELERQLADLPTAPTASAALKNGFAVFTPKVEQAISIANRIAPEHLELHLMHPESIAPELLHYGALFIGSGSGEVLGDYGAGPNHVLPTGGTARFTAGLSVYTFLRARTQIRIDDPAAARQLAEDAARLARLEGLEAHARAADLRSTTGKKR